MSSRRDLHRQSTLSVYAALPPVRGGGLRTVRRIEVLHLIWRAGGCSPTPWTALRPMSQTI
jgi:hypothetical protein